MKRPSIKNLWRKIKEVYHQGDFVVSMFWIVLIAAVVTSFLFKELITSLEQYLERLIADKIVDIFSAFHINNILILIMICLIVFIIIYIYKYIKVTCNSRVMCISNKTVFEALAIMFELSEEERGKIILGLEDHSMRSFGAGSYQHYQFSYQIIKSINQLNQQHLEFIVDTNVEKSIFKEWTNIISLILAMTAVAISLIGINVSEVYIIEMIILILIICVQISILILLSDKLQNKLMNHADDFFIRDMKDDWIEMYKIQFQEFHLAIIQRVLTETEQKGS